MGWMPAQVGESREGFPLIGLPTLGFSHTMSPALRDGAYAPYKCLPEAKTLAQGQFICPEHFNLSRHP